MCLDESGIISNRSGTVKFEINWKVMRRIKQNGHCKRFFRRCAKN